LLAAKYIFMPSVAEARLRRRVRIDGYVPTVENMTKVVMSALGWKGDSSATVKDKIWRPTRPIAHAAAALLLFYEDLIAASGENPFVVLMRSPELLNKIIRASEAIRGQLADVDKKRFRISRAIKFCVK
jgi:hypothetical protein